MTDKFISPCKPPEGRTDELLKCLIEECSEVIQRVTKAQRFGLDEIQPGQRLTNEERILEEVIDIQVVIEFLRECGRLEIDRQSEFEMVVRKRLKLERFLQTREDT